MFHLEDQGLSLPPRVLVLLGIVTEHAGNWSLTTAVNSQVVQECCNVYQNVERKFLIYPRASGGVMKWRIPRSQGGYLSLLAPKFLGGSLLTFMKVAPDVVSWASKAYSILSHLWCGPFYRIGMATLIQLSSDFLSLSGERSPCRTLKDPPNVWKCMISARIPLMQQVL